MGRHSKPAAQQRRAGRTVLTVVAALVLVAVGVAAVASMLGRSGGTSEAALPPTGTPLTHATAVLTSALPSSTPLSSSPLSSASTTASAAATTPAAATTAARPATLSYTVTATSYLRVREPGKRALVDKVLHKGDKGRFDQPVLQVVCGNAGGVRFVVDGKARPVGRSGQVVSFVAAR
jgi:hypothetical protein